MLRIISLFLLVSLSQCQANSEGLEAESTQQGNGGAILEPSIGKGKIYNIANWHNQAQMNEVFFTFSCQTS